METHAGTPQTASGRVRAPEASARPLAWLLVALWLLNVADLVLTYKALGFGATEANWVMGSLLEAGLLPAALFKLGVVTAGVLCLWWLRRYRMTIVATVLVTAIYVGVVVYELGNLA